MTATVRPAILEDVPWIAALEEENLGPDAWPGQLVADGVAGSVPTVRYLVAEADDRVVGYAVASVVADLAELQRLAVTPAHRRRRVATALVEAIAALAADGRADRLLLEVREDNEAAIRFYAARDFVEIDRRPRYYRDGTAALVLRRSLGRDRGAVGSGTTGRDGPPGTMTG